MRQKRIFAAVSGVALAGVFGAAAYAANPETVIAEVEFVTPVTISTNNALRFGLLDAGMLNAETVVISTASGVTDAAGNVLGGTQQAASLDVSATGSQPINILVDAISGGTGYTLTGFQCDYDGTGATACDVAGGVNATSAAGGSATLLIGATLTGNGGASPGVDNGQFNVTITYQ